MIETKDIIKMVTHIVRHDNGVPDTRIMHPMREWLIGIGGVLLGVLGGSLFALSIYHSYSLSMTGEIVVVETAVPYKAALVDQALDTYLTKRTAYEKIIGSKVEPNTVVPTSASTTVIIETELATSSQKTPLEVEPLVEVKVNTKKDVIPDLAI